MMKVTAVSAHIANDRIDRVMMIATQIGWGEIILVTEEHTHNASRLNCLTSTGILLVKGMDGALITAYPATIGQAQAMYDRSRLPDYLYRRIMKNQKLRRQWGV